MTRKYSTKRALIASALSLVLCFSMLVGTTFAWFTDTAVSAGNIIQTGNLDIEMYWAEGTEDPDAATWADASKGAIFDYELWEPGFVQVRHIKIENRGSLALKYTVNIGAEGQVDALSDVIDVYYLDPAAKIATAADLTDANKLGTLTEVLAGLGESGYGELEAGKADTITLALKMQETAGNEYQNNKIGASFTIQVLATQLASENDSFGNQYDKDAMILAKNAAEAQAALDEATPGATIYLASGNYGNLYFKANPGHSNTTEVDIADAWSHNYVRSIENVTIIGAAGAKVDAIVFSTGAQPGDCNNTVNIKNLVVDGVEFTDALPVSAAGYNAPIMITTSNATIDGLTVKNCKLIGDNSKLNLVYLYGADGSKNVTLANNTVDGIARLCELRGTENVTITGNTIKNTYEHGMLLAGANYSGNVTITDNTADGINDRFVRMAGAADATVEIKNNTIINYLGADDDYIKVTDGINNNSNVTIENNNLVSIGVKDAVAAQKALDRGTAGMTIQLQPDVNYGTLYLRPSADGDATKTVDWLGNNYGWETYSLFENVTILGAKGATVDAIEIEGGTYYYSEHSQDAEYPVMLSLVELKNVVIDGVTFTGKGGYDPQGYGNVINLSGNNIKVDGLTLKNCVLNNPENNARLIYKTESTTFVHNYAFEGDTYTFSPSLKNITVTDCTLNGGYMGLELRETENLTITNNIFNVADRNILLPANTGCTYSGNITITGNVSNNAQERFVRADGTGDAVVVIKDNTIVNYIGADEDYIKVTGGNNVTIKDNTMN